MNVESFHVRVQRMHRLEDNPNHLVKAFVDIVVNDALVITGLRVVDGKEGLFVSMPREQGRDKKWYDKIRFMEKPVRDYVEQVVLEDYRQEAIKA